MTLDANTSPALAPITPGHQRALDWLNAGPKRMLIGGKWVDAMSGKTFETINPSTGREADLGG